MPFVPKTMRVAHKLTRPRANPMRYCGHDAMPQSWWQCHCGKHSMVLCADCVRDLAGDLEKIETLGKCGSCQTLIVYPMDEEDEEKAKKALSREVRTRVGVCTCCSHDAHLGHCKTKHCSCYTVEGAAL